MFLKIEPGSRCRLDFVQHGQANASHAIRMQPGYSSSRIKVTVGPGKLMSRIVAPLLLTFPKHYDPEATLHMITPSGMEVDLAIKDLQTESSMDSPATFTLAARDIQYGLAVFVSLLSGIKVS
jgi:hypothetical protein